MHDVNPSNIRHCIVRIDCWARLLIVRIDTLMFKFNSPTSNNHCWAKWKCLKYRQRHFMNDTIYYMSRQANKHRFLSNMLLSCLLAQFSVLCSDNIITDMITCHCDHMSLRWSHVIALYRNSNYVTKWWRHLRRHRCWQPMKSLQLPIRYGCCCSRHSGQTRSSDRIQLPVSWLRYCVGFSLRRRRERSPSCHHGHQMAVLRCGQEDGHCRVQCCSVSPYWPP